MSWISDSPLTLLQRFVINVTKCGPIPRHVAFIMDGNRRYASKNNVRKYDGHAKGFEKLAETLQWCRALGITEVTVYAFSIENFKRTKEEVDTLMALACDKFEKLLAEKDKIMGAGVCIRVIGDVDLLSARLRRLIAEATLMTSANAAAYLNVAFAYTAREEMTQAVRRVAAGVRQGRLAEGDVAEAVLGRCLYTGASPDPDVLIRTSGEVRFSDFLLWQIAATKVCFTNVLWPDFTFWHLIYCVFMYQRACPELDKFRKGGSGAAGGGQVDEFFKEVERQRVAKMQAYLAL